MNFDCYKKHVKPKTSKKYIDYFIKKYNFDKRRMGDTISNIQYMCEFLMDYAVIAPKVQSTDLMFVKESKNCFANVASIPMFKEVKTEYDFCCLMAEFILDNENKKIKKFDYFMLLERVDEIERKVNAMYHY